MTAILSLPMCPQFLLQSIQISLSAESVRSNGWPFKSPVFCAVHRAQYHFQRVKKNSSIMGVNMYECPQCAQDSFAVSDDGNEVVLDGG